MPWHNRTRTRPVLLAMLAGAAIAAAMTAACTSSVSGSARSEPPASWEPSTPAVATTVPGGTSTAGSTADAPTGTSADAPAASGTNGPHDMITLGDLDTPPDAASVGAPFDPCALGWGAFPAEVRDPDDDPPKLRGPSADSAFDVGCRYDNSGSITVTVPVPGQEPPPQQNGELGPVFIALVVWGAELATDPARYEGSVPTTFGGKPGFTSAGTSSTGEPTCVALVTLAHGAGAVSITNSRFPGVDSCAVASSVANAIAASAP